MAEETIKKGTLKYKGDKIYPRTSVDMIVGLEDRLNASNIHTENKNNPHQVTLHQAATDLSTLPKRLGYKSGGDIYIRHNDVSYKMSLEDIKNMNTKIVLTEDSSSVNFEELSQGDFIYEEIQ